MTTSSNLQPWAKVEIVLVALNNPTDTKTLKFTNRPAKDGNATNFPLLQSYSGLGLAVGQDGMPRTGSGSIVIRDAWESLGYERRVFDLFDRYTAQNQAVTVYIANEDISQADVPTSWTLIYTGKVESVSKSKDVLSFQISNSLLPDQRIGYSVGQHPISYTAVGFTTANFEDNFLYPDSSIGKGTSLVFGNSTSGSIIPAWRASDKTVTNTDRNAGLYILGNYPEGFDPAIDRIYAKDQDGNFVNTYGYAGLGLQLNGTGGSAVTSHGLTEFLVPFVVDYDANGYGGLFYAFSWKCKGQNAVITPVGKIIANLYRAPKNGVTASEPSADVYSFSEDLFEWELVTSGSINKSDYLTQVRGVSSFDCVIPFDVPAAIGSFVDSSGVIPSNYYYAIGVVLTEYSGSATTDFTSANVSASSVHYYRITNGGGWAKTTAASPSGKLLDGTATNYTTDIQFRDGYKVWATAVSSSLALALNAYSDSDFTEQELSYYNLGVTDNAAGLITGVAFDYITRPDHVIKFLGLKYNGSAWVNGDLFDLSQYDYSSVFDGAYYRRVVGFTQGEQTLEEVVGQIVTDMSCALVPLSSGKLALYPWGLQLPVSKVFTDADILEISDIQESDPSTVVNSILVNYGKNYTGINEQYGASGNLENILGVIKKDSTTSGDFAILARSNTIYGNRELEETSAQFIGDENTALTRAKYLAFRHEHTHRTFTITVPYFDNLSLKVMDVVDVLSVHLPAHFGTSSKAGYPTNDGVEVDIYAGEYSRRAQRRRCQIIGLNNDYDGEFFKLEIELREIKPRHTEDPTAEDI
jgi:hypothetical protein